MCRFRKALMFDIDIYYQTYTVWYSCMWYSYIFLQDKRKVIN